MQFESIAMVPGVTSRACFPLYTGTKRVTGRGLSIGGQGCQQFAKGFKMEMDQHAAVALANCRPDTVPLSRLFMCLGCHLQHITKCQYTKECRTSRRSSSTSSSGRGADDQLLVPGERVAQNMCPLFGGVSRSCLLSRLRFGPR